MVFEDKVELAGAVASYVVAAVTGALAWATFSLARSTKASVADSERALKQADQHHRENLRPFCVIEFENAHEQKPFGYDFDVRTVDPGPHFRGGVDKRYISISGRLYNRGLGPARDVVVYLNLGSSVEGQAYWLTHPVVVCGLIAADESIPINVSIEPRHVVIEVANGNPVPLETLQGVANNAYEVVLRYRNIFDATFRTVHARGFVQKSLAELAITSDNKSEARESVRADRPTPVFLTGEQSWATVADLPQLPPE